MSSVQQDVILWLNKVVIGLNLCPFAARPVSEHRVRFQLSNATLEEELLADFRIELERLDQTPAAELETTLLIIPYALEDFFDYTQFLTWAQAQLKREGWQGIYQLASFHPHYCFAGADSDDDENLTNRSPYPIVHIIREASLSKALEYFDDVEAIPERNKACIAGLSSGQKETLFPYLFGVHPAPKS